MKTYITIVDGKRDRLMVQSDSYDVPGKDGVSQMQKDYPNTDWVLVPNDQETNAGDKMDWYDTITYKKINDEELIERGLLIDNKGTWYNKDNPAETMQINEFDIIVDHDVWTKEKPLEGEDAPYQYFDEDNNRWMVDEEKKLLAEAKRQEANNKFAIREIELKMMRSIIAEKAGVATAQDHEAFGDLFTQHEALAVQLRNAS